MFFTTPLLQYIISNNKKIQSFLDKHEEHFEKGKFRRYLWTHKENAELTCKADPGAKVVSRKEFEKDKLGYLKMELPI